MSQTIKTFQSKVGATPDGVIGAKIVRAAADYFNMSNTSAAHFFGQCHHETSGFRFFTENLNYSEPALLRVFSKYFDDGTHKLPAKDYARQPEKIANVVYANRMGNGDTETGDGYKYRGRGAIQLTGKNNYKKFASYMNDFSIIDDPSLVSDVYAFESALFFFDANNLWKHTTKVDDASIRIVSRRINGGFNGLADRIKQTKMYYRLLS